MQDKREWIIVLKPNQFSGKIATKAGERFKYPGQKFWVYPVLIDGQQTLITAFKELTMNPVNLDPTVVYNFQQIMLAGTCPSCNVKLNFNRCSMLPDIIYMATCCGMQYSLAVDTVKVLAVPVAALKEEDNLSDDDFFRELQSLIDEPYETSMVDKIV